LIDRTAIHEFVNRNQVYEISFILKDDPCITYSVLNLWYKHNSKFIQELEIVVHDRYVEGSELSIVATISKTKCIHNETKSNERSDVFMKEFEQIKQKEINGNVLVDIETVGKKICQITEYQMNIDLGLCSKKNTILFFSGFFCLLRVSFFLTFFFFKGIQRIAFHVLDDLMKECGTLSEIIIDTKSQVIKSDFFSSIQFRFADIENTLVKRKKK